MNERERLIQDLLNLANLLQYPEPGVPGWHFACERVALRIEEGIKKARA
jgi:hypothetical protein